MKKYWKWWKIITLILWASYLIIWLLICFVTFEMHNPIQPILDIPNQSDSFRGAVVGIWISVTYIKWTFIIYESNRRN